MNFRQANSWICFFEKEPFSDEIILAAFGKNLILIFFHFSQRPGVQRPGSSYAFDHEPGFAELIMSGRMTSKRKRDLTKKPVLEALAKASLSQPLKKPSEPVVKFKNEFDTINENELVKPNRVDSIVGMEKNMTTQERLIE